MKIPESKSSIFSPGWISLVFENLNQRYGAYDIRRMQRHMQGLAIILTVSVLFSLFTLSAIINRILVEALPAEQLTRDGIFDLTPPPPIPEVVRPASSPNNPAPEPRKSGGAPVVVRHNPEPATDPGPQPADPAPGTPGPEPVNPGGTPTGPSLIDPGPDVSSPSVVLVPEVNPSFPGGESELIRYFRNHIKYPDEARRKGISGLVYVEFTVFADGSVADVMVRKGIGGGCDEEAQRVIAQMPRWKPGKQAGVPVAVRFNLPIRFSLK